MKLHKKLIIAAVAVLAAAVAAENSYDLTGLDIEQPQLVIKKDLDGDGKAETITCTQEFLVEDDWNAKVGGRVAISDDPNTGWFEISDRLESIEFIDLNNDGTRQIVVRMTGGMHYFALYIYGCKQGWLYKIFEDGSACGVITEFSSWRPAIWVGEVNYDDPNWCYADEPLWYIWYWDGSKFRLSENSAQNDLH